MKIAIDLHIHSALSPCSEKEMTPNNIVNMAILKGLDAISVTDHNSCDNVEATIKAAGNRIIVLPGMELQTREDVHLLCYFSCINMLLSFDGVIKALSSSIANVPDIMGQQFIMDENDNIIGEKSQSLIFSVDMSIGQAVKEVISRGGVAVPAHIDRPHYGIVAQLGFIPREAGFHTLEISQQNKNIMNDRNVPLYIFSSDAHKLEDILERKMFIDVEKLSIEQIIYRFKGNIR